LTAILNHIYLPIVPVFHLTADDGEETCILDHLFPEHAQTEHNQKMRSSYSSLRKQTNKQTNKQASKQASKQTNKQTNKHVYALN